MARRLADIIKARNPNGTNQPDRDICNDDIRGTSDITQAQGPDSQGPAVVENPGNPSDQMPHDVNTKNRVFPNPEDNRSLSNHTLTKDDTTTNTNSVDIGTTKSLPEYQSKDVTQTGDTIRVHDEKSTMEAIKIGTDTSIMTKAQLLSLSKDKEIYVSYWDLGGDDLYHATHHAHLSSDAVFLLVFDVSGMGEKDETKRQIGEFFFFVIMVYVKIASCDNELVESGHLIEILVGI